MLQLSRDLLDYAQPFDAIVVKEVRYTRELLDIIADEVIDEPSLTVADARAVPLSEDFAPGRGPSR
jgi:hypothetical protein